MYTSYWIFGLLQRSQAIEDSAYILAELLLAFERDDEGRERPSRLLLALDPGGCRAPTETDETGSAAVEAGGLMGALKRGGVTEGGGSVGRLVTGCWALFLSLLPDSHVVVIPPSGSVARRDVAKGAARVVLDVGA